MSRKPNYVFDDELYHWGIPGQKWGERRYQNEDGSLTPEGREHYGYGDEKSKARITYNTQKYKADLKSKARMDKDVRSAKEERNRIKENAKTSRLARKEQGKFDRLNKKENARLDNQGRPKFGNTKNMSDDELKSAIDRLKLQAEYNKQYVLATNNNPMLIKADRFFEGPTGKLVADIAVKTIPDVTKTIVTKALENKKEEDPLDREKKIADIEFTKSQARHNNAQAAEREAKANVSYQEQHQKEVKERAEKMFGKNKDSSNKNTNKNSSNKNTNKESSNKTSAVGVKGQTWKVEPKNNSNSSSSSSSGLSRSEKFDEYDKKLDRLVRIRKKRHFL